MLSSTISKIKTDLRIVHSQLDGDISDMAEECLQDLAICGIKDPDETDPAILGAIKLFVRAHYFDDTNISSVYMARYESKKACLMMATGYGHPDWEPEP